MKNYTITVNGNVYDVTVEERQEAHLAQPAHLEELQHPAAAAPKAAAPAGAGSIKVGRSCRKGI